MHDDDLNDSDTTLTGPHPSHCIPFAHIMFLVSILCIPQF